MLRDYQKRGNEQTRKLLSEGKSVVAVAPTGAGKSIMMTDLLLDDVPQVVYTHRRVLLEQLAADLRKHGVNFGILANGYSPSRDAPIQLCMTQSVASRVKSGKWELPPAHRIHIDEIHANASSTMNALVRGHRSANPSARVVGWTATPTEIGHLCDAVNEIATVQELITDGYLVRPVVFTPNGPDVDRLAQVRQGANGEYDKKGLSRVFRNETVFGSVIQELERLNPLRRPTTLFGPDVAGSLWYAQNLTRHGFPFGHIDSKCIWMGGEFYPSDDEHRALLFDRVRKYDLMGVCNRFVLREGWNLPCIEHVIFACVFGDRVSWVQAGGRGLRPFPGKESCTFQDHGGNAWRFSALDEDEPWDITVPRRISYGMRKDRMADNPEIEPIVCPECDNVRSSGAECPVCGYRTHTRSRKVLEIDGALRKVVGPLYKRRETKREKGDSDTWAGLYWRAKKHRPSRTFKQIRAFYAQQNGWRWLPMDLPLMPKRSEDWSKKVGEVPYTDLIS